VLPVEYEYRHKYKVKQLTKPIPRIYCQIELLGKYGKITIYLWSDISVADVNGETYGA